MLSYHPIVLFESSMARVSLDFQGSDIIMGPNPGKCTVTWSSMSALTTGAAASALFTVGVPPPCGTPRDLCRSVYISRTLSATNSPINHAFYAEKASLSNTTLATLCDTQERIAPMTFLPSSSTR
jgi:hypothetical protein